MPNPTTQRKPETQEGQLERAIRDKTSEIEATGLCQWKYACPYCLEGNTPIRSSVSDAMVHHTSIGRVLCEPRDKPVSFGETLAGEPRTLILNADSGTGECPACGQTIQLREPRTPDEAKCPHERLNEEGICRACGADRRGI